ncbi:hypothetical protein [Nostoc sp.]|uniref:hypothetical protein n=1 Tax=Nostoc sp. TaxID=1180 RepID=UPI002FF79D29
MFRLHYQAGEAFGVVGIHQSIWQRCVGVARRRHRRKKSTLLHRVADLQSVQVNEVELLLMQSVPLFCTSMR